MHKNKILFLYIFFSFILYNTLYEHKIPKYKCGVDSIKQLPEKALYKSDTKSGNLKSRKLGIEDNFKDFEIFLDLSEFNDQIIEYNLTDRKEFYITGVRKAINIIKSLLKVKIHDKNYYITDEQLINAGIKKWDKTKLGNEIRDTHEGTLSLGIDLYIFLNLVKSEEIGENILASSVTLFMTKEEDPQPILGRININIDADYSMGNSLEYFGTTMLHQLTHILGFSSKYFSKNYFPHVFSKIDEYGIKRYYINSTRVLDVAKKYYNCSNIEGVQLEEGENEGSPGSHWEERYLLGEYMISNDYQEEVVISEFTLAFLEDTGYYKANYYTGGLMQFGKNKGCEFLNSKCVENGKVNPKFKNEYFDNIVQKYEPSCSSGRQSRAYKFLMDYDSGVPDYFQYYHSNTTGGPRELADYCPVFSGYSNIKDEQYFMGKCSEIGSKKYGSYTSYKDGNNKEKQFQNGEIANITGEKYSKNSFCVLSNLKPNNLIDNSIALNIPRAICYQMFCSDRSLTIQINKDYIVCPRSGGKIKAMDFDGNLFCPDYNLICSGTVICNDIFDCVEKKSLLKDVIYDYEIKTSQDILEQEDKENEVDFYELSNNGKCPLYCIQCNELGYCKNCKIGMGIVEVEQNNKIQRNCKPLNELEHGYYKNEENSIYFKCIDNCDKCINGNECITCNSGYFKKNNKCYDHIEEEDSDINEDESSNEYQDNYISIIITAFISLLLIVIILFCFIC